MATKILLSTLVLRAERLDHLLLKPVRDGFKLKGRIVTSYGGRGKYVEFDEYYEMLEKIVFTYSLYGLPVTIVGYDKRLNLSDEVVRYLTSKPRTRKGSYNLYRYLDKHFKVSLSTEVITKLPPYLLAEVMKDEIK